MMTIVMSTLILALGAEASALPELTVNGLLFRAPVPLAGPEKAGTDAWLFVGPPGAKPGEEALSLTVVFLSAEARQAMGLDEAGLLAYVKSTFLATAKPATGKKERIILGRSCQGDTQAFKIPRAGKLEVYPVPRTNGGVVVLGFRWDPGQLDDAAAERIIADVTASLKDPG